MQHRRVVADRVDVQSLGMWLLVIAGVGVGLGIGPLGSWSILLIASCAIGLGLATIRHRGHRAIFLATLVALGVARGGEYRVRTPVEADRRGLPPPMRAVQVLGASTPGPRCRVSAQTPSGARVELALPTESCPLSWGVSILVPSEELHTDTARGSPDRRKSVFVSRGWVRPPSPRPWWGDLRAGVSASLARVRQTGWEAARGDPARGFVVASSLGLSDALPPEVRARVRRAGLGHLVAVSGLHVGLAAIMWLSGLRWLLASRWWGAKASVVASTVPVLAYVILTGAAAPAVRAAIMFGLVAVGAVLGRPTHGPSVLVVAAALMVFASPDWLLDPGFHLSFAAMIVLVGLPSGASPSFTSWHLGWALLPLLWLHFDAGSDGSVLANAVALPVFALWVVPSAVIGWGLLPWVGPAAIDPAAAGASLILDVAELVSGWPELPREAWLAAAVLSWMPFVRRRMSTRGRAWLPNRVSTLFLIAVAVVSSWPMEPRAGWIAWSAGREPEVLAVTPDGRACVRAPSRSVGLWRSRLDEVGVHVVSGIQPVGHVSISDPATEAWLRGVTRGMPRRGAPRCRLPLDGVVRAALDRCRAYAHPPSARRPEEGPLQCWSARLGMWRNVPLHSP